MKLNIDNMSEVTRLTRLGRLTEAMAVLKDVNRTTETSSPEVPPFIDMTPTDGTGTHWSASFDRGTSEAPAAKRSPKPKFDSLAELVKRGRPFPTGGDGTAKAPPIPDGARFTEDRFAGPEGNRTYKLYVPSTYEGQPAGLLVMLHGCTQTADDFATGTRMNALAEANGYLVAYPVQTQAANLNRCWNWFNTADQGRDRGEPSIIAGITRKIMSEYRIDPEGVFVAGLSAGGAMAAIMAAAYPELYRGVGIHSGLPVGAAHDMPSAFAAMSQGGKNSNRTASSVPMIIFHGDADRTVNVKNAEDLAEHSTSSYSHAQISVEVSAAGGLAFTRSVAKIASRAPVMEYWKLHGSGHAWSGGDSAGSYTEPRGPDASKEMVRFFAACRGQWQMG